MMRAISAAIALLAATAIGAEPSAPKEGGRAAADRLGLRVATSAPLDIEAGELLVADEQPSDRVVFQGGVRVRQADLNLRCDWLEAIYPSGAGTGGRPERIHARGSVEIAQGDVTARCSEAIYESARCRLLCTHQAGDAQLQRGDHVVRGDQIEFDVCKGVLKVRGARVHIASEKPKGSP
jgi:lipopolysaccharide transport protein LptA